MVLAMGHEWWRGGTAPGSVGLCTEPVLVTSARPRFASPPPALLGVCCGCRGGRGARRGGGGSEHLEEPRLAGAAAARGGELCRSQRCGNLKRRWLGTRLHERWHWGRAQPPRPPPPLRVREAKSHFWLPLQAIPRRLLQPWRGRSRGGAPCSPRRDPVCLRPALLQVGAAPPQHPLSLSLCPSLGGSLREEKNTTTKQDEDAPAAAMPSPRGTATGSAVVPLPTPRTRARGEPPRSAAASLRPGCGRGRKISSTPGGGRLHPAPLRS